MTDYESTDEQYEDRIATLATLDFDEGAEGENAAYELGEDDGLCDECYGLWEPEEQGYDHRFGCSWYAY
jgi:hypothetical protein